MKTKYRNLIISGIILGAFATVAVTATEAASTKFAAGDRIYVAISTANVRQTPAGTLLGTQPNGARGTVTQGPIDAVLYGTNVHWWVINFDSGIDGWVGEDRLSKVTATTLAPTPTPTPTSAASVTTSQRTYTVVAGDTLSIIGKRLGIAWLDIAAWNNMVYPYFLSIGRVLYVSAPSGSAPAPTSTPTPTPTASATPTPSPTATPVSTAGALFSDTFAQYPDGIITNEYTFWGGSGGKVSANWEMTSGSLFAQGGAGWTGVPNAGAPNALSSGANNSVIFRLTTKRADFGNVAVDFDLLNQGLTTSGATPAVDWDGIHVFLRYQSEESLYYASINRRDNTVIVKKKVPGGPSNGGTYYNIGYSKSYAVPYGSWKHIKATIKNNADGSVTIQLFADGTQILSSTDAGTGGAPIRNAGKTGIRGDNTNFKFKNFIVTAI